MASKVFFLNFGKSEAALDGIDTLLKAVLRPGTLRGRRTAIKLHFGELGNYTHIRPQFVRRVADSIKVDGGEPFTTDTTTIYPGSRLSVAGVLSGARYNGFTEEGLECPMTVADEPDGEGGTDIELEGVDPGDRLRRIRVAKHIAEAEAVIMLSHVKGHPFSGMGGAIKNLGMGCTTKGCKAIQHALHGLVFVREGCNACGKCIDACIYHALEMGAEGPVKDEDACVYCGTCLWECGSHAITLLPDGKERFQEGVAKAAAGVTRLLAGRPVVYMNFLLDITHFCDCAASLGQLVFQNAGILASSDPVAADKASLDILDKMVAIPGWGQKAPDVLGKLNGTSSLIQLKAAERLGVGSMNYELVEI